MNILCSIAVAALAGAPLIFGVETKSWVHNDHSDFEKGTLKRLSLRSDGRLSLAPEFRELTDPSIAYLWALAVDSKGNLYTGGGTPGESSARLLMVEPGGKSRTVAELEGLQIQAIAIDRQDRIYAATAPDGKVYRISGSGKPEVFYDPKAHYIWSLAFNSRGDLFIATGNTGEVHRVAPDGQGSVFFRTEETHARSLAVDKSDNLIVGTEPGGLVIRVSPAGQGFVLYQGARREVTAVSVAKDGSIYAAAVGSRTGSTGPSISIPVPPAPVPAAPAASAMAARVIAPAASATAISASGAPPASVSGGSEVYRIGTDNYPQRVWSHATDIVYGIAFDSGGRPVLGTGNKGNLYRINSELISTLLVDAAPTQITALAATPGGRLYAATGNVGKVYAIGPDFEKQGTYESDPLDVGFFSYWGRASARSDENGGRVRFDTRSGNLDRPQNNWSAWSPPDAQGRVTSPSARFLQYRITIEAAPDGKSPDIREIEVAYKARNVAPQITGVEITPANYKFNASPSLTLSGSSTAQSITLQPIGAARRSTPSLSIDSLSASTMSYAKGFTGARWAATDPNQDEMRYQLEIRGVRETDWKLLRDKIREKYASWDSTAFPDGDYVLRVTASDISDNPPDQALSATLESDRFVIDNTPPRITNLTGNRSGNKISVQWRARDERSIISKAEYSLNGGEWTPVDPNGGISDAPELEYSLSLSGSLAESTVAVRVTDEYDNQSVDKIVIR